MAVIKKGRPFERNMLIVCEDTNTAPNYLSPLKDLSISHQCWDYIEIYPKPPIESEREIAQAAVNPHKTGRKKRQFETTGNDDEWMTLELEKEYLEQPVCYVKTAQKALEDGSYAEVWAVFDLDGHTGHARAAALALIPINGQTVNIAFSSRSIELWFLLHFGQYGQAFQKTSCKKDDGGREQHCNVEILCTNEGRGECLSGFLRRNTLLTNYLKNDTEIYHLLEPHLFEAFQNANWLRSQYEPNIPFFERNPYTSMDMLVKRMLRIMIPGDQIQIGGFNLRLEQIFPTICLVMENCSKKRQVIRKDHFGVWDQNNVEIEFNFECPKAVWEEGESNPVELRIDYKIEDEQVIWLKYPKDNEANFIRIRFTTI
jgi:hypothetical protein